MSGIIFFEISQKQTRQIQETKKFSVRRLLSTDTYYRPRTYRLLTTTQTSQARTKSKHRACVIAAANARAIYARD